jgi:CDP-6-deoxy-D-xylo-4-hexulose-3-dehydrase
MENHGIYSNLAATQVDARDLNSIKLNQAIKDYCTQNHNFSFDIKNPKVRLHEPTFGAEEIIAATNVLLSTRVTMGPNVLGFERTFANMNDSSFGVSSNSGSSANLLAIAALSNEMYMNRLKPGDEVIVPALSWSTTVWPLIQYGLVPVIVDIDLQTFNICPNEIKKAISPKTKAIMPVHVYGNPCNMDELIQISEDNNLLLIEDCCEALGAKFKNKAVGKFGQVGTFSFYFSHHITTLEGGITVSDDKQIAEIMRSLRAHGWTRELEDKKIYTDLYPDIDPRFLFVNLGYNLRITELQAAIGLVQLPKLDKFIEIRKLNTLAWRADLSNLAQYFDFQQDTTNSEGSYFGFAMILKKTAPFGVAEITSFLNKMGIETRPIICGNIALQPAIKKYPHRVVGNLSNSTIVMQRGFSFGNHQSINKPARDYVVEAINSFLKSINL